MGRRRVANCWRKEKVAEDWEEVWQSEEARQLDQGGPWPSATTGVFSGTPGLSVIRPTRAMKGRELSACLEQPARHLAFSYLPGTFLQMLWF